MFSSSLSRRTLVVSLLVHILLFAFFSFSFGRRLPQLDYTTVSFLGALLDRFDLTRHSCPGEVIRISKAEKPLFAPARAEKADRLSFVYYHKPFTYLPAGGQKLFYLPDKTRREALPRRKESVIMFYPQLPYQFLLYFKDRQKAHIELMFNIRPGVKANSFALKRKVSSGNLEADLLSMRYIGHYLFTQTAHLPKNSWQTIKIDLEPRKEQ